MERSEMASALVVGYDGSECATAALEEAIKLAGTTGDRIVISFGYEPAGYGEERGAHREEVRKFGEQVTAAAIERAKEAGVDAELALIAERPVDALLTLADEHDARAIVVGTHGESPFRGAILGSTPHKLLHVSQRPVLVVPVPES
jgi:nucleotide-binding universal stress UspA family protein